MSHVAVIGCGVVGAAIAYELSKESGLSITVLDRQPPAQGSTGAALGVLMGAISKKKGRAWQLRQMSMQRYETLIPELEARTGRPIAFNRSGIVMLCFGEEELASWEKLCFTRQSQGWHLELWNRTQLQSHCPQLHNDKIIGAIYSPQDRQVDPTALTQSLVTAAEGNGVTFRFGVTVESVTSKKLEGCDHPQFCSQLHTNVGQFDVDGVVVAAGLGSTPLTASLEQVVDIRPVLGQALHLRIERPLGNPHFQPVITGNDVHIVPVSERDYWIGATVEFPDEMGDVVAQPALLDQVRQEAIAFCPALADATIVRTWAGKRPRPEGQPAPIISQLPGYSNVWVATGHYRNGVLLAPATAQVICEAIVSAMSKH